MDRGGRDDRRDSRRRSRSRSYEGRRRPSSGGGSAERRRRSDGGSGKDARPRAEPAAAPQLAAEPAAPPVPAPQPAPAPIELVAPSRDNLKQLMATRSDLEALREVERLLVGEPGVGGCVSVSGCSVVRRMPSRPAPSCLPTSLRNLALAASRDMPLLRVECSAQLPAPELAQPDVPARPVCAHPL